MLLLLLLFFFVCFLCFFFFVVVFLFFNLEGIVVMLVKTKYNTISQNILDQKL